MSIDVTVPDGTVVHVNHGNISRPDTCNCSYNVGFDDTQPNDKLVLVYITQDQWREIFRKVEHRTALGTFELDDPKLFLQFSEPPFKLVLNDVGGMNVYGPVYFREPTEQDEAITRERACKAHRQYAGTPKLHEVVLEENQRKNMVYKDFMDLVNVELEVARSDDANEEWFMVIDPRHHKFSFDSKRVLHSSFDENIYVFKQLKGDSTYKQFISKFSLTSAHLKAIQAKADARHGKGRVVIES